MLGMPENEFRKGLIPLPPYDMQDTEVPRSKSPAEPTLVSDIAETPILSPPSESSTSHHILPPSSCARFIYVKYRAGMVAFDPNTLEAEADGSL